MTFTVRLWAGVHCSPGPFRSWCSVSGGEGAGSPHLNPCMNPPHPGCHPWLGVHTWATRALGLELKQREQRSRWIPGSGEMLPFWSLGGSRALQAGWAPFRQSRFRGSADPYCRESSCGQGWVSLCGWRTSFRTRQTLVCHLLTL